MPDPAAELIARCRQGDRTAQHSLYEMFQERVFRMVVRMVGRDAAPDVTQQVFLQAFRNISRFAGRSLFATWLHRVTANECLQHRRRSRRHTVEPLQHDPPVAVRSQIDRVEDRDLLEQALRNVEPELATIFLLRETEGLSYDEIADVLEISAGTVASRLNRARRRLRAQLVELGWEP